MYNGILASPAMASLVGLDWLHNHVFVCCGDMGWDSERKMHSPKSMTALNLGFLKFGKTITTLKTREG